MSFKKWKSFIFSDYEIDQFRKPDTGPGSIPHTKEEAKKSGMNENEWRNEGQTQPQAGMNIVFESRQLHVNLVFFSKSGLFRLSFT